ncbi:glycerol-3-phosphate acyltransferase 2, mitochondrial [Pholidichthys leucotaenia]
MEQEKNDKINKDMVLPQIQQKRPACSWQLKIKKKLKTVPHLGMLRPVVGQCCHQCTPDSRRKKLGQNYSLGFRNMLNINETQTSYRGWLVRRVCCVLFVSGRSAYGSPVGNRLERVCQSSRVREALATQHEAPEGGDSRRQPDPLLPFLPLINTCISSAVLRFVGWVMLKIFASLFGSIQINLNHLSALHGAEQEGSVLIYVYMSQSPMDCALIPLVLFCCNLRVPYTVYPHQIKSSFLRSILQKVGVVLLPPSALTEQDAEMDTLYSPVMISLLREVLHEGQALSVGVSAESGLGGQWLDHIRQLIKEESVPDVNVVPVGISYDCVPKTNIQVGLGSLFKWLGSFLCRNPEGSVRIHFAQPFSLKEMCESGRCRVGEWLPLQDLLLPVILFNRTTCLFGQRRMSWLLPSRYASQPKKSDNSEKNLTIAIILHLIFSASSCMAVMSTSLVSSLLLYKHRKGVRTSVLCRDVAWLTEELLFRGRDVGFGGSLPVVVHYSLSLLAPHLLIAAWPSRKDPLIVPHPSLASTLHLSLQSKTVTDTFILEAVGACAVSAMLREVAVNGVGSSARSDHKEGEGVKGDLEFDVVLCESELTERALQLCHLLPPGFVPPCQPAQSFAREAIDSLVHCGILIMEEVARDTPICDFWKKWSPLTWTTSDDPYHSDSDCEAPDLHSYKIGQPARCPEMIFFLSRMLAGPLRALCWTVLGLEHIATPLPETEFCARIHSHLCDTANENKQVYESCSEEAACTAVRTLIDLGVLLEECREEGVFLGVAPLFQLSENRQKLHHFISQYLYN